LLAGGQAGDGFEGEGLRKLPLGESPDAGCRCFEGLLQGWVELLPGLGGFDFRNADGLAFFEAVELDREGLKCWVSALAHFAQDCADRGEDGFEGRAAALLELGEDLGGLLGGAALGFEEFHSWRLGFCAFPLSSPTEGDEGGKLSVVEVEAKS
jgi:hypothetical protein